MEQKQYPFIETSFIGDGWKELTWLQWHDNNYNDMNMLMLFFVVLLGGVGVGVGVAFSLSVLIVLLENYAYEEECC